MPSALSGFLLQPVGDGLHRNGEPGEGEHLPPQVFQRCADVVDIAVVDDQEAVVALAASADVDRRILVVVPVEVKLQLGRYPGGVDGGGDSPGAFAQEGEHRFVYVVVDKHERLVGRTYQVGGKLVGIEYPVVAKDAFHGGEGRCERKSRSFLRYASSFAPAVRYGC